MQVKKDVPRVSTNKKRCRDVRKNDIVGKKKDAIEKVKEDNKKAKDQKKALKKATQPEPKLRKAIWKCWSICGCGKSLEINTKKMGWCRCFRCGKTFTYDAVRKYNRRDN